MNARPLFTLTLWSLQRLVDCDPGIPLPGGCVIFIARYTGNEKGTNEY